MAQGAQTTDRPWTVEDVRQLRELAREGVSAQLVALKTKRAETEVHAKAGELGLSLKAT